MLLIGLQNEFIVQLDQLDSAGFLATQDDVAVLSQRDRSRQVLKLENSLDGFEAFSKFWVLCLRRRLGQLIDVDSCRNCGRHQVCHRTLTEGDV